ncbi:MAG: hypothetical protein HGB10_11430 [Coriobacteriia bacterium]|nr:hypothetical protein [Coriobacteriia bacterium]
MQTTHRAGRSRASSTSLRGIFLLLIAFAVALSAGVLSAFAGVNSWTAAVDPPAGGWVSRAGYSADRGAFLASMGSDGIYESSTGASWSKVATGYPTSRWANDVVVAADGSVVAATGNGILRLAPGAPVWPNVASTNTSSTQLYAVYRMPLTNTLLTAGPNTARLFRSTDNGSTWTSATVGVAHVRAFASDGATAYAGAARSAGIGGGLWVSTDDGDHWVQQDNGIPTDQHVYGLWFGATVWHATGGSGVYRSTNRGASWTKVFNSDQPPSSIVGEASGAVDVATNGDGIFRSADGTTGWTNIGGGANGGVVSSLAINGSTLIAGSYGGGFVRTTDPGVTALSESNSGLVPIYNGNVVFGPNDSLFTVAEYDANLLTDAGLRVSRDDGQSWTAVAAAGLVGNIYDLQRTPDGRVLASTDFGLWETTDSLTWHYVIDNTSWTYATSTSTDGTYTVAGGYQQVLAAHVGDSAWTVLPTDGLPVASAQQAVSVALAHDGSVLSTWWVDPNIYRLAPGASQWETITPASVNAGMKYFAVDTAGRVFIAGAGAGGVAVSIDDGLTFEPTPGYPLYQTSQITATDDGAILVSTASGPLYRSGDGGASWVEIGSGSNGALAVAAAPGGRELLAGIGRGIHRYTISPPSVTASSTPALPAASGWFTTATTIGLARVGAGVTKYHWDNATDDATTTAHALVGAPEGSHVLSYRGAFDLGDDDVATMTVRVDTRAPSGTMKLRNGASTTNSLHVIVNSALTDTASGLSVMRFKSPSTWGSFKPYAATTVVTLPRGNGTKRVTGAYRDAAGHEKQLSDTINFKRTTASLSKPVVSPSSPTRNVNFTISGTTGQYVSGSTKLMVYRKVGSKWKLYKTYSASNVSRGVGSAYSKTIKLSTRGTWGVIANTPTTSGAYAGLSARRTFTVK